MKFDKLANEYLRVLTESHPDPTRTYEGDIVSNTVRDIMKIISDAKDFTYVQGVIAQKVKDLDQNTKDEIYLTLKDEIQDHDDLDPYDPTLEYSLKQALNPSIKNIVRSDHPYHNRKSENAEESHPEGCDCQTCVRKRYEGNKPLVSKVYHKTNGKYRPNPIQPR